ncbi:hypothetical protein ACFX13_017610 [Malus domestica]
MAEVDESKKLEFESPSDPPPTLTTAPVEKEKPLVEAPKDPVSHKDKYEIPQPLLFESKAEPDESKALTIVVDKPSEPITEEKRQIIRLRQIAPNVAARADDPSPGPRSASSATLLPHVALHGIDHSKNQLPCTNCKAILNVPHGIARFRCPQCQVDMAVDVSKLYSSQQISAGSGANKSASASATVTVTMMLQHQLMMSKSGASDSGFGPIGLSLGNNDDFEPSNNDVGDGSSFKFLNQASRRNSNNSTRSSGELSSDDVFGGGKERGIPRVSNDLKDVLSMFQQTFVVFDTTKPDCPSYEAEALSQADEFYT